MLIGREREVAEIGAAIAAATAGRSETLFLVGEPGIGKSALLAEARRVAEESGLGVIGAHGLEAERDLAFSGLIELVGPLPDVRASLPEVQRAALATALAQEEGEPPDPFAVAAALLGAISLLAEEGDGLLVAIDDAQWLDRQSLDAILFAARRLSHQGVAFVLASRPSPDFELRGGAVRRLELRGLEPAAAAALLDEAAPRSLALDPRRRVLEVAAGNPLALIETPRSLSPGQLAGEEPMPETIRPGAAIERSFRGRVDELGAEARAALVVAAAAEEVDLATCRRALEERGLPVTALDPAEEAGIVGSEGGMVSFRHPLLRSVAYHLGTAEERRAAHRAIADAVADLGHRAWHLAQAATGPDETVAASLAAAAEDSRSRGALNSAGELAALAAAHTADADLRVERTLAAASDLARTGMLKRAAALLDSVATASGDDVLALRVRHDRAVLSMRLGDLTAGHRLLHDAAGAIEDRDSATAARMLVVANFRDWMAGDFESLRVTAGRAAALAAAAKPPAKALIEVAEIHDAVVAILTGQVVPRDVIQRHEGLLVTGVSEVEYEAFAAAIHAAVWIEQLDWAERVLAPVIADRRARSALTELIYPLAILSDIERRHGNLEVARAHGDEAVALAIETGQPEMLALASGPLALTEAALGMSEACREHAATSIALCEEAGAAAMSLWGRAALGRLAVLAGDWEAAIEPLGECEAIGTRIGLREPRFGAWAADLLEARVRVGDVDGARRVLAELEESAAATGGGWTRGAAARGRALLGSDEEVDEHFGASAAAFESGRASFEQARTLLLWGERLRRARRRSDSRGPLRRAVGLFERCGQRSLADRARRELEASGETVAGRAPELRDQLTPHELRIALRVAEGRTNPEVASELFVSRKTVEHHLSQIYRKLGVRSRTELARVLAPGLPAHPESARALADPVG